MKLKLFSLVFVLLCTAHTAVAIEVMVKDGDSLESGDRRIRLDGIDAPELYQICRDAQNNDYECGKESLHYLENMTVQKDVNCECLEQKDRYHREICECFVDNMSVNRAMIASGWAITYRDKTYLKEQETAERSKLGLWQGKYMRPAIYRALHKPEKEIKIAP